MAEKEKASSDTKLRRDDRSKEFLGNTDNLERHRGLSIKMLL